MKTHITEETKRARILVVEDDPFVREGIVRLINRQDDLTCCGEADSIVATGPAVAEQKPHLILLDLRLKDGDAFELIERLKLQSPDVPVLILSQFAALFHIEKALRAGAKGYVTKQEAVEEMLHAIRAVLLGNLYVSHEIAGPFIHRLLQAQP
jgi:DNA-binding NarL/FixJ family response regulator